MSGYPEGDRLPPPPGNGHFLRTERLGFRLWIQRDEPFALGLWGDPAVTKWIGGPFTHEQVRRRLAQEISMQRESGVQYWPVFLLEGGEHVGCCGLRPRPDESGVFELGVHVRPKHQRRGFAQEASRAVIEHAFGALGAASLFAGHHPENEPSRRLLAALGFEHTHDEYDEPTELEHPSYRLRRE